LKGEGPRSLAVGSTKLFVGQYFSDAVELVDYKNINITSHLFFLNNLKPDLKRKGEIMFYSSKMCFENWQSCSSCHPEGRTDGFNWDLLNDGIGNPKNVLSLLYSFQTPPSMSTGIRENARIAVRAGMKYIMFVDKNEDYAQAIDAFLMSMRPMPSPYLPDGELSESAQKGKAIFEKEGCTHCHNGPYLTDQKLYDVGTTNKFDMKLDAGNQPVPQKLFDTPALIELWRTAPYLHDGRYYKIEELFERSSHGIKMGSDGLSESEISQLSDYLRSL
jgi:cytochrome c peroxidase